LIVVDEFAFLDPKILESVIIPIFQLDQTVLLGVSTVTDDENLMAKFIQMKDNNGMQLFYVCSFSVHVTSAEPFLMKLRLPVNTICMFCRVGFPVAKRKLKSHDGGFREFPAGNSRSHIQCS